MTDALRDRIALVTGAARGIGRACAERFAREGATVVGVDLDVEGLAALSDPSGGSVRYEVCDVSDGAAVTALFERVAARHGRIDVLLNNAAILRMAPFLEMSERDYDDVMRVNAKSVFLCSQAAARHMVAQGGGGTIVNMSSINAVLAIPTHAAYAAAKGAVLQLTKAMAIALAPHGIRVNAVGPGTVATEMARQNTLSNPEKMRAMLSRTPLGRPGEPDEIASVAVFLASDQSSYVTGQTVYADGGRMYLNMTVPVPE